MGGGGRQGWGRSCLGSLLEICPHESKVKEDSRPSREDSASAGQEGRAASFRRSLIWKEWTKCSVSRLQPGLSGTGKQGCWQPHRQGAGAFSPTCTARLGRIGSIPEWGRDRAAGERFSYQGSAGGNRWMWGQLALTFRATIQSSSIFPSFDNSETACIILSFFLHLEVEKLISYEMTQGRSKD